MSLRIILQLFICYILQSCSDSRVEIARKYVEENINNYGQFNVAIEDFKKIDGENYMNRYNGQERYALEFVATVRTNQTGYIQIEKDKRVENFHILNYKPEPVAKNTIFDQGQTIKYIKVSDQFEIHSKVIMMKKESGWEAINITMLLE